MTKKCAMRLLRLLFGPKLMEFAMFVFTRGDYFGSDVDASFDHEVIKPLGIEIQTTSSTDSAIDHGSNALESLNFHETEDDTSSSSSSSGCGSNAAGVSGGARALKQWLKMAGNRYILFDNISKPTSQVDRLINMIHLNLGRIKALQANSLSSSSATNAIDNENHADNGKATPVSPSPSTSSSYGYADFEIHANTLTEAQRQALHDPLTPEKQAEQARLLSGQVGSLKKEVGGLKEMLQQMSQDQTATLMQIINQLRQQNNK
jgi:hypothetical protein